MRVLLFGLQSSGASIVTQFLGQIPGSLALVDLWCGHRMFPAELFPDDRPVFAKATLACTRSLSEHVEAFRPARRILVLRHPCHNHVSLGRKSYRDHGGRMREKFRRLEGTFRERHRFDLTLRYEDLIHAPDGFLDRLRGIGVPVTRDCLSFSRTLADLQARTASLPDLALALGSSWGSGNARDGGLHPRLLYKWVPPRVRDEVRGLCPGLLSHYDRYEARGPGRGRVLGAGLLHDVLPRAIRRLRTSLPRNGGSER